MYTWTYPYQNNHNPDELAWFDAYRETLRAQRNYEKAVRDASRPS
jgi:hypothetical protein